MGLLKSDIKLLCYISSLNKEIFKGNVLSISQLAVYGNLFQIRDILTSFGIKKISLPKNFDTTNKIDSWSNTKYKNNTNVKTLLKLLGVKQTTICDISTYENPDITFDLNYKIKKNYINKYDLLLDFGTLEHIFDVPQALENYVRMTKKNGYIVIGSPCSNMIDHSFYMFSPTLFYDYFQKNGFKIYKCFLKTRSPYYPYKRTKFYEYLGQGAEIPILPNKCTEVIIIAKKIKNQRKILKPNQFVYTFNSHWDKKKNTNNTIVEPHIHNSLQKKLKNMITSKFTPFFIQRIFFSVYRGKNIKKLYL